MHAFCAETQSLMPWVRWMIRDMTDETIKTTYHFTLREDGVKYFSIYLVSLPQQAIYVPFNVCQWGRHEAEWKKKRKKKLSCRFWIRGLRQYNLILLVFWQQSKTSARNCFSTRFKQSCHPQLVLGITECLSREWKKIAGESSICLLAWCNKSLKSKRQSKFLCVKQ